MAAAGALTTLLYIVLTIFPIVEVRSRFSFAAKIITDASLTYNFTPRVGFTLGANNLFDVYPDEIAFPSLTASGQTPYTRFTSQFGFMGAYYFSALRFSF